ncbi:hypothetical protein [Micromonospora sp. NPDC050200]|uniref:hypothetical protein n=1 Tax=Micromonospora sp. NPDC050200 TaxID=3155664 RepID=UPI0033FA23C0
MPRQKTFDVSSLAGITATISFSVVEDSSPQTSRPVPQMRPSPTTSLWYAREIAASATHTRAARVTG